MFPEPVETICTATFAMRFPEASRAVIEIVACATPSAASPEFGTAVADDALGSGRGGSGLVSHFSQDAINAVKIARKTRPARMSL